MQRQTNRRGAVRADQDRHREEVTAPDRDMPNHGPMEAVGEVGGLTGLPLFAIGGVLAEVHRLTRGQAGRRDGTVADQVDARRHPR